MSKRLSEATRKKMIIKAAVRISRRAGGWSALTRASIAREAKCSDGLVSRHLGDMQNVRATVMTQAVTEEILEIIAQSIAANDGFACKKKLPEALRQKALTSLLG